MTGFSHQTTPQGHTYRLTTPTSTVFVQRSFGHGHSATVSSRTPTLKRQINETAPVEVNNTTEAVFDSLQGAVDVLTKSSLGYMNQAEIEQNNLALENDIESIQKEIETLQKDIEILNKAEITYDLTKDENTDEIFSLKENLDNLVQGFDSVPVDVVENHKDINTPQFQHFPLVNVENIYDKDAIESLLVDFTEPGVGEVIETNQFDEILLSNYMVNNHQTNQPNAVVRDSDPAGLQQKIPASVPQKTAEIIKGNPIEKVAGPLENFPRAEKLVSIPDTVSSFITSVKSFISYDGDSKAGSQPSQPKAQFTPSSTTEKLGVSDVALKSNPVLSPGSEEQFVKYIPSPHLNTRPSTYKPPTQQTRDSVSLEEAEEEAEDVQKFWPESKLNVTYQENWIG